jgi:hypothetical protein
MASPLVEIRDGGRGGSITYVEGEYRIPFDWEFALSPTLALLWGPRAAGWDAAYPWAAGRQAEIYAFVGAEVVRQKANGHHAIFDLEAGTMDIVRGPAPSRLEVAEAAGQAPTEGYRQFLASVVQPWQSWREDQHYDLAALGTLRPEELEAAARLLTTRDVGWREVEALAAIDLPESESALRAALHHHLSVDARLAAAEALARRDPSFDLESILARQLRLLHRPAEGMRRALRLARQHSTPNIQQALLWASYNGTECAPHCAELLLELCGAGPVPEDRAADGLLSRLGLHTSSFDRDAAFATLSSRVGMTLDTSQAD